MLATFIVLATSASPTTHVMLNAPLPTAMPVPPPVLVPVEPGTPTVKITFIPILTLTLTTTAPQPSPLQNIQSACHLFWFNWGEKLSS
ncbi:hypothetical protein BDV93DRAFT_524612 [Ceratobasidium sp. AG-I]|nr:hypothetical protein BDV93DRAFT_524612 [Ceratobasidium sp. AG-I]